MVHSAQDLRFSIPISVISSINSNSKKSFRHSAGILAILLRLKSRKLP